MPSRIRHIKISQAVHKQVLTYPQVLSGLQDFILPFGGQEYGEDFRFSDLRLKTFLMNERGRGHNMQRLGRSGEIPKGVTF